MKLKLISDGTLQGTKVVDEQGNSIGKVTKVEWSVDANEMNVYQRNARCTLELMDVPAELEIEIHEIFRGQFVIAK
jgi:hypothetical protein